MPKRALPRWHTRGYLPHWEAGVRAQFITFRLADSLPAELLERLTIQLRSRGEVSSPMNLEHAARIEAALDAGHGACFLRDPRIAAIIVQALLHFDGVRYRVHAWVIMPNHVHVLVTPLAAHALAGIVHSWKSYTAKEANRILDRTGSFWQREYYDRAIRDAEHFNATADYIHKNPVVAGLCATERAWPWSSAR